MRVVRELSYPHCKVTILSWNNRYLIKLEQGLLEQTYKVDQTDFASDEELLQLIDGEFLAHALQNFEQMGRAFHDSRQRHDL